MNIEIKDELFGYFSVYINDKYIQTRYPDMVKFHEFSSLDVQPRSFTQIIFNFGDEG